MREKPIDVLDRGAGDRGVHRLHRRRTTDSPPPATRLDAGRRRSVPIDLVESEDHALELVRTLNADRRHLTEAQRKEVAVALRLDGHSYRAIAGALGVDHKTAMADVAKSATGEGSPVALPERVTGGPASTLTGGQDAAKTGKILA